MEGGGIQHFQIKLKFWHYRTNKFDLQAHKHKHMKLFIDIVIKQIYLFNIVAWNYRKKIGFPVCKKENFAGLQAHRKRGKSARASPTPHHTLNEERSARFTAQPLSALIVVVQNNGKKMYKKSVLHVQSCFFANLIRPVVVFHSSPALPSPFSITRF